MELLLATRNAGKVREFRDLLSDQVELLDVSQWPDVALPEETGSTFEENATLKAVAVSKQVQRSDTLVLADDSGLEVDALGGAPGVLSARYAGAAASDRQNVVKLLGELDDENDRRGRFRCVLAIARDGELVTTFAGVVEGSITPAPRGTLGFGYDPVFVPNGYTATFGELPRELKSQISHRARAARALREWLRHERE